MTRGEARVHAFKLLFSIAFQKEAPVEELISQYLDCFVEEKIREKDRLFIQQEVAGAAACLEELDSRIGQHLLEWSLDRIASTDLAILRLAVYELLYREDIPSRVSVNEAVELSKVYSPDKSPSFVNGVLAHFMEKKA